MTSNSHADASQSPVVTESGLPWLDVDSPAFAADPHEAIRAVRSQGRLAASRRGIEVLGHTDVHALLSEERLRSQDDNVYRRYGAGERMVAFAEEGLLSSMQEDKHDRIRRVFLAAFRVKNVERQRDLMRSVAEDLVQRWPMEGQGDFVALFSSPYPMEVLCRIIGVPVEDIGEFSSAATKLHLLAQTPLAPGFPAIEEALGQLWEYCTSLIESRRAHPTDDTISALIGVQETQGRVSDDELIWSLVNLIFAGQDTTRYQLASALRAVVEVPGLWEQMATVDGLVPAVTEEALRFYPVVNFVVRIPTEALIYEGVEMTAGRRVILNVQASSRDPDRFVEPDRFTPREPGRHAHSFDIPFGLGMHYCLGAALARAEIQEALSVLASRIADVQMEGERVMTEAAGMLYGPEAMGIAFERRW